MKCLMCGDPAKPRKTTVLDGTMLCEFHFGFQLADEDHFNYRMQQNKATMTPPIEDHPNQIIIPGDDGMPIVDRVRPRQRSRAFKDQKDVVIHSIAPRGGEFPEGTLLPLPSVPRFLSLKEARAWVVEHGGDLLMGMQIVIHRVLDIAMVELERKPVVKLTTKRKYRRDEVADELEDENPELSDGEEGPSSSNGVQS